MARRMSNTFLHGVHILSGLYYLKASFMELENYRKKISAQ